MVSLQKHIQLSFQRLSEGKYQIQNLFQPAEYDWPGDWEGRALLAFCNLYEMTGNKIPAMDAFMEQMPYKVNDQGFFGNTFTPGVSFADEQQLSGHGWLLCGLCEYYKISKNIKALEMAEKIVNNLFLPVLAYYDSYPITKKDRNYCCHKEGEVSGSVAGYSNGWKLSTDIGCAFICLDGMSRYYSITKESKVGDFIEKLAEVFVTIDKVGEQVQTHATLTASRGIYRYYLETSKEKYGEMVISQFREYVDKGMTSTYENFNWFGREDTWTEPCAVTDSLILATELYKKTGEEEYRTLARKIWFNAMQFCHRANGGAGPNTCVTPAQPYLAISMYEAPFCCTMRYNEGLLCVYNNEELFEAPEEGEILAAIDTKDGAKVLLSEIPFPEDTPVKYKLIF